MNLLISCSLILVVSLFVHILLGVLFSKNRTTRLFKPILHCVFFMLLIDITTNFIYVNIKMTKPLSRVAYGLNESGNQVSIASPKVANANFSLATGTVFQS